MPWPVAAVALRTVSATLGIRQAIRLARARKYISTTENGRGTAGHYNIFESMLTGRDPQDKGGPTELYDDVFKANVLRASSMARKVTQLLEQG